MVHWRKATLVTGHAIYLDLEKASATKRVRGQGKEFTAIYFGANAEPFEVVESPEELLSIEAKPGAI